MAPITRSSVHGRQSQHGSHRDHLDSHLHEHPVGDLEMADDDEQFGQEGARNEDDFLIFSGDMPIVTFDGVRAGSNMLISTSADAQSPYRSSAQEILQPLQDTADRVSRQVEEFAKALDKFVAHREPTDQHLWDEALALLERYSKIAQSRKTKTPSDDADDQLGKIQLESDLWLLLGGVLSCNSPETANNVQIAQGSRLGGLHRYSTNIELWNAFLDSDDAAQEYECILSWLQDRAASNSPPIEDVLRRLTEKSERGEGIWSAGPIYTQAAIKQQKRTRVWSLPLEPSNPGLNRSHVRTTDNLPLVAQLDPDARSRESAELQEQDEYHEKAAWQTYWEMLRRGQSNAQIRSWWAERKEVWRYVTLRDCGANAGEMVNSPWLRILNSASNSEWLERCERLAENPYVLDQYQKAVYGVLCGNMAAAKSANRTIDDNLFSIFNALLIQRYQHYVQAYRKKLVEASAGIYHSQPSSTAQIRQYSAIAQSDPSTKDEAHHPHRLLELAIMSKDFDSFFVSVGHAAAQFAHTTGQGSHLMTNSSADVSEVALVNAQDPDAVRMVAHLQLLLRSLGFLASSYREDEYAMENNIASYIGLLELQGKFQLIPLYASKLSEQRSYHVLGAVLIKVTDPRERDHQIKLLKHYNINVPEVMNGIFSLANFHDIQKIRNYGHGPAPPRITMTVGTGKTAQVKVRPSLMTGDLSEADEKAVRSVEWVRYVDVDNWGAAAWTVSLLYKVFLIEGRFVALRQLLDRVRLSDMSLAAVGMNLNFVDTDLSVEHEESEDEDMDEDRVQSISPSRKRKEHVLDRPSTRTGIDRYTLALKCLIWRQLEQLASAIDHLDMFQEIADSLEANRSNPTLMRTFKRDLKKALEGLRLAMQPLLENEFLCQPQDEMESVLLSDLRNHYIPECILAYNSALWFAGHYLSRVWLVECMSLAQLVAEVPMLTAAFVEGRRMKELVRAFAVDSQALLQASEQSGSGSAKKIKADRGNADIWKVTWKEEQGPLDLEALD